MRDAASSGDLRRQLEALRDLLAARLESATPGETASLARQFAEVARAIADLPAKEKSNLDDLVARRDKRRAAVQERAGGAELGGSGGG